MTNVMRKLSEAIYEALDQDETLKEVTVTMDLDDQEIKEFLELELYDNYQYTFKENTITLTYIKPLIEENDADDLDDPFEDLI